MKAKSSKKTTQKMTLDKLASMVQRGFTVIGESFDKLEGKVGKVENEVSGLKTEVSELKVGVSSLNRRVGVVEDKIDNIADHIEFQDLSARVKYLEDRAGVVSGK